MATKKQKQAALIAQAGAVIDSTGAVRLGDGMLDFGEWVFMTEGGPLKLTLADDLTQAKQEPTFTLFARYEYPMKAKAAGLLERYNTSSKWNHHGIVDCDELAAILLRVSLNAPARHEQAAALLHYRATEALQRLIWKAEDYNSLLRAEARETLGYRDQLGAYIANAKSIIKECEATNG